jgi:hypothetical protein
MGQNKPARVLGHVPRHTDQFSGKLKRKAEPAIANVEVELLDLLLAYAVGRPAPDKPRQ